MAAKLPAALSDSFCAGAVDGTTLQIAEQWVWLLHAAFYDHSATRGSNRFQELELTLRGVCEQLSSDHAAKFWPFMAQVLLLLASPIKKVLSNADQVEAVEPANDKKAKKKAKNAKPLAPIAFLVVTALKKLSDANEASATVCRALGRTHSELHSFCKQSLEERRGSVVRVAPMLS